MAKTSTTATWGSKLYVIWIILGISLFVNAILISFIMFANSKYGDVYMLNRAHNNACTRDYDWFVNNIDTTESKVLFTEGVCQRDAVTGADFNFKVVNDHLVRQP